MFQKSGRTKVQEESHLEHPSEEFASLTIFTRTILGVMITGVTFNGTLIGFRSDCVQVEIKHMTIQQKHSWKFRFFCHEQAQANPDTGAAVNTFSPLVRRGMGDGSFYRTASGERVP